MSLWSNGGDLGVEYQTTSRGWSEWSDILTSLPVVYYVVIDTENHFFSR